MKNKLEIDLAECKIYTLFSTIMGFNTEKDPSYSITESKSTTSLSSIGNGSNVLEDDPFSFPIKDKRTWDLYKIQMSQMWHLEELDLSGDYDDWMTLNDDERFFLSNILAFFAASDKLVMDNVSNNFYAEAINFEMQSFYAAQLLSETVHNETYNMLIDVLIKDRDEKNKLFQSLHTNPIVAKKAAYAQRYMDPSTTSKAERMLAFLIFEGVFFSSSFCAIFWISNRQQLKGLKTANEFISKDEGTHAEAAVHFLSMIEEKLSTETVVRMFTEAVVIETEFVSDVLPVRLLGMNAESMVEYIKYVADYWIVKIGEDRVFNSKNPYQFMDSLSLENHTNFFESRNTSYSAPGVGIEDANADKGFSIDEAF